jgi:hypothetical protein
VDITLKDATTIKLDDKTTWPQDDDLCVVWNSDGENPWLVICVIDEDVPFWMEDMAKSYSPAKEDERYVVLNVENW